MTKQPQLLIKKLANLLGQLAFSKSTKTYFFVQLHSGKFPCVFKVGHAHGGLGKVRVETPSGFQVRKAFFKSRACAIGLGKVLLETPSGFQVRKAFFKSRACAIGLGKVRLKTPSGFQVRKAFLKLGMRNWTRQSARRDT
jgi:Synapsin, ATP binding domain